MAEPGFEWTVEVRPRDTMPEKKSFGGASRKVWDLPYHAMDDGDILLIRMPISRARKRANAIRSAVCREQRATGKRYSVYLSEDPEGIQIWRRFEDEE